MPDDVEVWEWVLSTFTDLIDLDEPPLPAPGHQSEWEAFDPPEERSKLEYQASSAMRRLIDLGATTEDLYAVARSIRALTLADAMRALAPDNEGELAGELFGTYLEMERPV